MFLVASLPPWPHPPARHHLRAGIVLVGYIDAACPGVGYRHHLHPGRARIQRTPLANSLSWMKRQPARSAAPRSSLAPEMPRMLPTIT